MSLFKQKLNVTKGIIKKGKKREALIDMINQAKRNYPDEDIKSFLIDFIRSELDSQSSENEVDRAYFRPMSFDEEINALREAIISRRPNKSNPTITTMDIACEMLRDLGFEEELQSPNKEDTIDVYYGNVCIKLKKNNSAFIIMDLADVCGLTFDEETRVGQISDDLRDFGVSDDNGIVTIDSRTIDYYIKHKGTKNRNIQSLAMSEELLRIGNLLGNERPEGYIEV